jgi:hypothetical protein
MIKEGDQFEFRFKLLNHQENPENKVVWNPGHGRRLIRFSKLRWLDEHTEVGFLLAPSERALGYKVFSTRPVPPSKHLEAFTLDNVVYTVDQPVFDHARSRINDLEAVRTSYLITPEAEGGFEVLDDSGLVLAAAAEIVIARRSAVGQEPAQLAA